MQLVFELFSLPEGKFRTHDKPKIRPGERPHLTYLEEQSHMIPRLRGALNRMRLRYKRSQMPDFG